MSGWNGTFAFTIWVELGRSVRVLRYVPTNLMSGEISS